MPGLPPPGDARGSRSAAVAARRWPGVEAPLELVLAGGERLPLVEDVVIGRSPGSTIQLDDPSVSRTHARISVGDGRIEDAGSSHGTFVDGAMLAGPLALRDGMLIRIGDQELKVERRRDSAEAGRTIVVRPGASLVVGAVGAGAGVAGQATQFGMRPRMRSGYALKRLDADEGARRWVLRDLSRDGYLRLSDNDAQLLELLDGTRSLVDLIGEAEQRFGASGPARLARLLADLGERGFLAGVARARRPGPSAEPSFLRRLMTPREKVVRRASARGSTGSTGAAAGCCSRGPRCGRSRRSAWSASACSPRWSRSATARRSWSRTRSASAGSSSCSAASPSSPSTRRRTGSRCPRSGGASRRRGSSWS